ncbi:MAG: putative Ig domain-containing protein, partial [Verrucomicrobiales bacterium]|nr:putative Ig domain-containing protein [Verrucomicrobiales bacterium]
VPPTVNSSPASLIVPVDEPTVEFVSSFNGTVGTLQWKRGSAVLKGATSETLGLSNVKLADAGLYTVKSTNLAGNATTAPADLVVVDTSPRLIVQPLNGKAVLIADAAGPILGYEWRKNGVPLTQVTGKSEGVQTKTLTLKALTSGDADVYTCMITGSAGSLESGPFTLAVTDGTPQVIDPIGFLDGMVGDAYSFVPAVLAGDSIQPTKWAATGLPRGLKINALTGEIFGVPTVAGTFTVKVTASNPSGKGATVAAPLVIQKIPEGAVGSFVALLDRSGLNAGLGGRLELSTTAGGAYSGKLILGGTTLRFSRGKLNIGVGRNHPNEIIIARPRPQSPLKLTWTLDPTNNLITSGQVEDTADAGSNCSITSGWRKIWTATMLADSYLGQYNFSLDNLGYTPGDTSQPGGVGYGSFKVASAKTGILTIAGRLADDTPFTMATFVGPTGQVGLFQTLYTNRGSVLGNVVIAPLGAAPAYADSSIAGAINWLKQAQPATVLAYPGGFGPLNLTATGLKYAAPPATANVLSTSVFTADLDFEADGLSAASLNPDAVAFPLSLKNVATLGGHPAKTSLKIIASTGLFSGTFTLLDYTPAKVVRTVAYKGIIIRNSSGDGAGAGYFLLPQTGFPKPIPSYSGSVELGATPP